MAKKSAIARNERRKKLADQYKERREELRATFKDSTLDPEVREEAYRKLVKLPRNSSSTRVRNRCALTGRSRGYYRKFGLSRIALRDLALRGDLPGVIKASW